MVLEVWSKTVRGWRLCPSGDWLAPVSIALTGEESCCIWKPAKRSLLLLMKAVKRRFYPNQGKAEID